MTPALWYYGMQSVVLALSSATVLTYFLGINSCFASLLAELILQIAETDSSSVLQLYGRAHGWARYLAQLDSTTHVPHEKIPNVGENIYWMTLAKTPYSQYAQKAVKMWYDENRKYDYKTGGYSPYTAHFTQMVWKSTTQIGCGFSVSSSSTIFVVCKYYPQGNIPGQYQSNVLPPSK